MVDSNPPVTTKQAMPFDSLLAQCRDLVCERLAQALEGMLDKVDETLSALINESQDRDMRKLYLETKDKALAQRKPIAELFGAQYLKEFQVRSNRVKKTAQSFSEYDSSTLELDLVGEDDLNETLKVNDMATKLRQYCDEELVALDQRVGVLLGDANLEAEDNPFSPQAICDAFKHTCRSIVSNVKVRMVFLKLFDDHVLDDIRPIYKAVNGLLVQNSILPKIRFAVARGKEGSKAPSAAAQSEAPAAPVAHAASSIPSDGPNFFSVLQDLIASNVKAMTQPAAVGASGASAQGVAAMPGFPLLPGTPGLAAADGGPMVVLQGAELTNFLTRIQHGDVTTVASGGPPLLASAGEPGTTNVLRELKATSVGTGMNQLDSMTLDIVAMLFDQLFDDPKIPISVKGLIGRMQIPMLKVAIADKAFFSKKSHPARRLLDTLGEISSRLPGDFNASNPLFGRLEGIIQELMNSFQDNMEIFDVVREQVAILLEEEDRRVEEETRSAAKRIEQNESLAASKTMAEFEVKARVEAGNLPRPVIAFLVHQWVKPLLIVHVRRGQHSDAWKNSLATMDLLISSVEAKHTPEERSNLATAVPDLLKRLAAGLRIAGVEDAIRERFFSELKDLHTEAMSMGREGEVAVAPEASEEIGAATPDIVFSGGPVPEPEETVQPIPGAATEVPDLSQIQMLDPMETVQPTPAADTELPDFPPIHFPEPKETVPLNPAVTSHASAPPRISAEEPKPPVRPIPAATGHVPASPKIPVPAPSQTSKPMSPSAGHTPPAPPKIPVPEPGQPVRPTPSTAAQVPAPGQPVRPSPPTAAQAPATRGTTVQTPRPMAKAIPPSAPRARAPVVAEETEFESLDFTKSITIKNPFGAGQVHVEELESMDVRAAGTPRAKGEVNDVEFINNLKEGTWVEFREKGEDDMHRPAKLSYISPLRSSFLFIDQQGKTVKECSRTELGRLVRLGMVVVVDAVVEEAPLFDRMMAGVIGKLT